MSKLKSGGYPLNVRLAPLWLRPLIAILLLILWIWLSVVNNEHGAALSEEDRQRKYTADRLHDVLHPIRGGIAVKKTNNAGLRVCFIFSTKVEQIGLTNVCKSVVSPTITNVYRRLLHACLKCLSTERFVCQTTQFVF